MPAAAAGLDGDPGRDALDYVTEGLRVSDPRTGH